MKQGVYFFPLWLVKVCFDFMLEYICKLLHVKQSFKYKFNCDESNSILDILSSGRAEWMDKSHKKCLILWLRIQDWADHIIKFVSTIHISS